MRQVTAITILVMITATFVLPQKHIFPGREILNRESKIFFDQVMVNSPLISRIEFMVNSENYLSAYLSLCDYILRKKSFLHFLEQIRVELQKDKNKILHLTTEATKKNYLALQQKLKLSDLEFYFSVIYTIYKESSVNALSGTNAFYLWNILLEIANKTFDGTKKSASNLAVLYLAARFQFFKNSKKWQKRVKRYSKKISPDPGWDLLQKLIFAEIFSENRPEK